MSQRNPDWTRDEVLLALDLYFRFNPSRITPAHPEVVALSKLLNALPIHPPHLRAQNFRSPDGVHMKMFNLQWLDPSTPSGLASVSRTDKEVWDEFGHDPERVHALAQAIRAGMASPEGAAIVTPLDDEEEEAPEGKVLLRLHKLRERNGALVRKKKALAKHNKGVLDCEVCGFVFSERYGALGEDFIECHHTLPLSQLKPGHKTQLKDLALVCANCHRMLHRGGELITIDALREIVQATPSAPPEP